MRCYKCSQTGLIHSRISPEHCHSWTQSLLQSLTGWSDCWGVSCGAGWWRFKPSWHGVRGPAFGLNGATRQMILTATYPSASDSIKRREVASTLSEKLSKVPLIPSSRMSTQQCSFHLYTPQNTAGPYVNCHFVSSLEQVLGPSPTVRLGGDWRSLQNNMSNICLTEGLLLSFSIY